MTKPQLFSFVKPYYKTPLIVDRAEDCWVYDESGRKFLDCYSAVASISVGHARNEVLKAVEEQMRRVHQTTMLYQTKALESYINLLQKQLPRTLSRHFFVNSGSEAIDFACQAARAHRRKATIIALSQGFHGGTFLAKSVTGLADWQPVFNNSTDVIIHHANQCKTCPDSGWKRDTKRLQPIPGSCSGHCLCNLEKQLTEAADEVSAIILEPALGVGGIIVPCKGFFARLQRICEQGGIDLILDEVQTGFGRCGTRLFLFQLLGLHPDILCLGKGIANGFPMGLVSASENVSAAMAEKFHFSTFGGNPVSCAAAKATLEVILHENLVRKVEQVGSYFLDQLDANMADLDAVLEIRGIGLLIGVELKSAEIAQKTLQHCFENGLLIGLGGAERNVIRLEPPLTFSVSMVDETVKTLCDAIRAVS